MDMDMLDRMDMLDFVEMVNKVDMDPLRPFIRLIWLTLGRSTFPTMVIFYLHYPEIKLLLGKQELSKKSGFLDNNPKRDNCFQVVKGFWKNYKWNYDQILYWPYLLL